MNDIFENTKTMKENDHPRFYTAESVMRGHPDKLCDLIADSVLDECLKHDPASRVACEVMATHGHIIVAGEITTLAKPDVFNIVRDTLRDVGYDPKAYQIDCYIHDQSPDIAGAVEPELVEGEDEDTLGAGDQGVMVGYAWPDRAQAHGGYLRHLCAPRRWCVRRKRPDQSRPQRRVYGAVHCQKHCCYTPCNTLSGDAGVCHWAGRAGYGGCEYVWHL